ncbi:hypothetical protein KPL39_14560 [Clostridium gasigenes]|uniref:hypothetical protein n=1 Tax=Clostridium gasigenes TaxID=94869 RepID=UPI001C0E514C|nr:hypothetical protein [Clostridium gasigenes]MBU3137485.1 hypothetical protein [Clostridium gasigenes]
MIKNSNIINAKITLEIRLNDDDELIVKLNKICTELNLELDVIIKSALIKLYNDIEFIRGLKIKW